MSLLALQEVDGARGVEALKSYLNRRLPNDGSSTTWDCHTVQLRPPRAECSAFLWKTDGNLKPETFVGMKNISLGEVSARGHVLSSSN